MFAPAFEKEFGDEIKCGDVKNDMASSVIRLLYGEDYPYAHFTSAHRAEDGAVTIKFEVDVERPQKMAAPIARKEQIAARFKDNTLPKVYALRPEFPSDVPHLNLAGKDTPPWLCLDERPWDEVKSRWTAFRFIERIRWWLAATARGDLHGDAQPAEPVFGGNTGLIVPSDFLLSDWPADRTLAIHAVNNATEPNTIRMREGAPSGKSEDDNFITVCLTSRPLPMQRLRFAPENIKQLHDTVNEWGIDLVNTLRKLVGDFSSSDYKKLECRPLILLQVPLLKTDGFSSGQSDLKAFIPLRDYNFARIGGELGVLYEAAEKNERPGLRIPVDEGMQGEKIPVIALSVHADYSRDVAASAAGLPVDKRAVSIIGAGAIGSHLIEIMRRDGFGAWTILDHDTFLPHNVQRHRLAAPMVGLPKASAMARHVDFIVGVENETTSICANVLHECSDVNANLQNADLIVDASASIPVARRLSDLSEISAPRLSVFFNPAGSDVVLLAEDNDRSITLAALEAQYYRAILEIPSLANHLLEKGSGYQYAGSCRSVAFKMPEHQTSMLTGAIAGDMRRRINGTGAAIVVWANQPETGLKREAIHVYAIDRHVIGEWEVIIDRGLIETAAKRRAEALPNETGGILLGTIDIPRRTICVVQIVSAPNDSSGSSAGFERGVKNLKLIIEEAQRKTAGQVEYIGEWHSHPAGVAPTPSTTDIKQLYWLGTERVIEELPAVMLIIGDDSCHTISMAVPLTPQAMA